MVDLYTRPDWNFAFSSGFPSHGATICSFARYDPSQLYTVEGTEAAAAVEPLTPDEERLMLCRCMKVRACMHIDALAWLMCVRACFWGFTYLFLACCHAQVLAHEALHLFGLSVRMPSMRSLLPHFLCSVVDMCACAFRSHVKCMSAA